MLRLRNSLKRHKLVIQNQLLRNLCDLIIFVWLIVWFFIFFFSKILLLLSPYYETIWHEAMTDRNSWLLKVLRQG